MVPLKGIVDPLPNLAIFLAIKPFNVYATPTMAHDGIFARRAYTSG
jgi:hypothetical protein